MKTRIVSGIIAVVMLVLLSSCTEQVRDSGWTADPFTVLQAVTDQLEVKDLPEGGNFYDSKVTEEETPGYMDEFARLEAFKDNSGKADFAPVESYGIYVPESKKATNIGILKAKSADDLKAVQELAKNRVKSVQTKFSSYIPEEDAIAKKSLIKTDGVYVYYIIAANPSKIEDMIIAEMGKTVSSATT